MRMFWHNGYEATSMRDLADVCELSTRSMYDSFGDKRRFFDGVLAHYHEQVLTPVVEMLTTHRGLDALHQFVELLVANSSHDGCLYVNTRAERHAIDSSSVRRVDNYARTLRSLVREKLLEARVDGDFDGDLDLRTIQLTVAITGFLVSLRSGGSADTLAVALRAVLADIARD